jgi:hypothetical protein
MKKLPNKKVLDQHIRKLTWVSTALSALLAVGSGALLNSSATDVTLSHAARDELASGGGTVLAPASTVLATVELRYVLVAIFAFSTIASLLLATKLRANYERTLKNNTSGWRWLFMGVAAALLLEYLYLLVGINDLFVLKLGGGLVLATALLGWMSERENKIAGRAKWLAFSTSVLTGVLAWLPIVGSLIGTSIYGMERFGWHVYALVVVLLVGFVAFAVNTFLQIKKHRQWRDYLFTERNYLAVGVLVKVAVGAIVFTALHR